MVDIKLIYHRLEEKKGEWVEEVSRCIVDSFQLGDNEDPNEDNNNAVDHRLEHAIGSAGCA